MEDDQIIATVSKKGRISISELLASVEPAERAVAELRVLRLVKRGVLRLEPSGQGMILTMGASQGREPIPFESAEVALVATMPLGAHSLSGRPRSYIDLLDALNTLIAGAKRELRISSPFADPETIALLRPSFRRAAGGGVMVKFLTRSARDRQLLAALKSLYDTYAKLGAPDKFSLRCYEESVAGLLVEAVHAKVVISDDDMAYVGSGELRKHSITADVEIGVLMRGAVVKQLVDLFDAVWERAKSIKLANF